MDSDNALLSTGQVARYCQVSRVTVSNWIRAGKLKAFLTPGRRYRVRLLDFVEFARRHQFPVERKLLFADGPRVLVVDDDADTALFLQRVLQSAPEQYTVDVAHDGYEAGLKLGTFRPDLLVLDLMMPGLDGFTLCRQIRRSDAGRALKILAITGHPDPAVADRALAAGADRCLHKPLRIDDLRRHAREVLATV